MFAVNFFAGKVVGCDARVCGREFGARGWMIEERGAELQCARVYVVYMWGHAMTQLRVAPLARVADM